MTPKKIRVYYNWRNPDNGKPWSFDYGDVSTETNVTAIEIAAYMVSGYNPDAPKNEPSGWLENFALVRAKITDDDVLQISVPV